MTLRRVVWVLVWIVLIGGAAFLVLSWFATRPTLVPDLDRMTVSEATGLLDQADLALGKTGQVATESVGADLITDQSPAAGSSARPRSAVDVTVAVAPENALVPDVVGQDAASALQTLADALYVPRTLELFSEEAAQGTVLKQVPAAGEQWMTGNLVALSVSAGPDDGTGVKVPDVVGLTAPAALNSLNEEGLIGTSYVTPVGGGTVPTVLGQVPAAGSVIRSGSTVLLLFDLP